MEVPPPDRGWALVRLGEGRLITGQTGREEADHWSDWDGGGLSDWVPHVVDLAGFVVRVASRAKHYVKVGVRVDLIVRVDVSRPVPPRQQV